MEDRRADYRTIDAFSLAAENCWNAGVVLGPASGDWRRLALEAAPTRLWINEAPAGEGRAGDALGHPFEAVAWLANLLNRRGRLLRRDMFVMTGSSITTKFPAAGDACARHRWLGEVSLELSAVRGVGRRQGPARRPLSKGSVLCLVAVALTPSPG